MGKYESVTTNSNLSFQIDSNLSGNLENAISNLKPKGAINTTTSVKDVAGIKGLTVQSTGSASLNDKKKVDFNSAVKVQYEKKINSDFKIKTGARLASGKITIDAMLETSNGFGIGIEANATLKLSELRKNGVYLVVAVPLFGMQMVVKYNPFTEDVTVILRVPLPDGNDEDKKGADDCACSPIYVTVDVIHESYILNDPIYVAPIQNAPIQNAPIYKTNRVRYEQSVDDGNILSDIGEGIGNGIVAVAEGIGNGLTAVFNGIGSLFSFRPKKKTSVEQYVYN